MTSLDRFLPAPRLWQIDHVTVGVPKDEAWEAARHIDLARSTIVRELFALRTLPDRVHGQAAQTRRLGIDDVASPPSGFRVLDERPGESVTVGAIGKVWQSVIEFAHVSPEQFASFDKPGWVKVAWELRCEPRGAAVTRVVVDLRVEATDEVSWQRFERYFRLVGPFSHFIRRHVLGSLAHDLGGPEKAEQVQPLAGDDLIPDPAGAATHGVTIDAPPEAIWPWLVQMGCRRAGWYSWDVLDNAGVTSAREIHQEWQAINVGDILPATPHGSDGFEVLHVNAPRSLILGSLVDIENGRQLRFGSPRPKRYFQGTWAFDLESLDELTTRLHVRNRVAFKPGTLTPLMHLFILVHPFMQTAQLRNLRNRVEAAAARTAQA